MENIYRLLAAYCAGSLSEEEAAALRKRIETEPEVHQLFDEIRQTEILLKEARMQERMSEERAWSVFQAKWKLVVRRKHRRIRYYAWGSVAAVAVILWCISFLGFPREEVLPIAQQSADIQPGCLRATLLLADGEQIPLGAASAAPVMTSAGTVIANDSLLGLQYQQGNGQMMNEEVPYHTIVVPKGGEYHFTLSDGSRIWLNSASELRFPTRFTGAIREIYVQGEIFCEVAEDKKHPFIVHVGERAIRVLGTAFNVSAYPDEQQLVTTLIRGAVEFSYEGGCVSLEPGDQTILDAAGQIHRQKVDVSLYTSWVKGIFEFDEMPLEEIVRQLARWYDVQFCFEAEEFRSHPFTGFASRDQTLEKVLAMIEKTTDVKFDISGRNVNVKRTEDGANISRPDY